jgi:3-dehydroquinate synthase
VSEDRLTVELGERSYPIVLAPLSALGTTMAEVLSPGPCALITNPVVRPLHGDAAVASLTAAGWAPTVFEVPDGEAHKTLATWQALVMELLGAGVDRRTPLIALGGGVTGDEVGFAAATALRGVPFVQVPTTLLAMVDASVGGKTGVNTPHGKNLVGAFHQPRLVLADVETLATLSDAEFRCGLGEVVKHAVLADPRFFAWLEEHVSDVLAREHTALVHCVRRCCAIKAAVVAADERESGARALLNLGHTIGHAIEKTLGFGVIRHGEAVGIGMVAEARLAVQRGVAAPELPLRIGRLLVALELPVSWPGLAPQALLDAATMDKKMSRGRLTLTIPRRLGEVRLEQVDLWELTGAAESVSKPLED